MRHENELNSNTNKPLPPGAVARDVERYRAGVRTRMRDAVAEEIPIAFVYNERPHAVMMATPADLEDFALGFSLSEAIIDEAVQCKKVEIVEALAGIELHITIPTEKAALLDDRVRQLTGRTGCGLCGAQTLDAAVRHPVAVADCATIDAASLKRALGAMQLAQAINSVTGATHAAAWATPQGQIVLLREDVGRHNALDKLIGAMLRRDRGENSPVTSTLAAGNDISDGTADIDSSDGFLIVTSRASYEMVMKAATVGIGFLAAISAPTALAIALAKETNLTLVGFARADGFSVYANAQRIADAVQ